MDALVAHLKHVRLITDYFYVSAITILIYDYLLTLKLEVTWVWSSSEFGWSYTKVLFLLTRYVPFVLSFLFLYNQLGVDVPQSVCVRTYPASTWLVLFSMNIAEVILVIRTWAIWRKHKGVGSLLLLLMVVDLILQCWSMAKFNNSLEFIPPFYPGYRGCNISKVNSALKWNYVFMIIIEVVVLALMGVSAFRTAQMGDNNKLMKVIHRDGIMFYVYILIVSIANALIIKYAAHDLLGLLSPLQAVIYSALTSRIIFNIRETARRSPLDSVELHTQYQESQMQFAARDSLQLRSV